MSNRAETVPSSTARGAFRLITGAVAAIAVMTTALAPIAGAPSAWAGTGSRVAGTAWADSDADGVRDTGEPVRSGVTVVLLDAAGSPVPGYSTTTAANGTYAFTNVPDGDYSVRFDAPAEFDFPSAGEPGANGPDNDAVRLGNPVGSEPERGTTAPFTVAAASQHLGIDAGVQPLAQIRLQMLPGDGCEGMLMRDGGIAAPLDADDADGHDSSASNCRVRTRDTVEQTFGVDVDGLVSDTASIANVIVEFVVHAENGADLELVPSSTHADGLPDSCLTQGQGGANPGSTIVYHSPESGDITIRCNVGRMTSNLTDIRVSYRHTGETAIPSYAHISARAYAAGGDARVSNEVDGPDVVVTGYAEWELTKSFYNTGNAPGGPDYTELDFDGQTLQGYRVQYQFTIEDMMGDAGGSELDWSTVTFTDSMPEFPGARIIDCRSFNLSDSPAIRSPWQLSCPEGEVQGADGWQLSITPLTPNAANGTDDTFGRMVMTVFIPYDEMGAVVGPNGEVSFDNAAKDTDHWALPGGGTALNHGDGQEPGFDGTGDNLATVNGTALAPVWDLAKSFRGGPAFSTEMIDGIAVDGYIVEYNLRVRDVNGPDNIGPWLDSPVTFTDQLLTHPDAYLLACVAESWGDPNRAAIDAADLSCSLGQQDADGWEFSFTPNQTGFDRREARIVARMFIPLDQIPNDPCQQNVTLDLKNQAINTEHWTAHGEPNNGTGFEPNGWNTPEELESGLAATGTNNVVENRIRPSASNCGTVTGQKNFVSTETGGWYPADPFAFRTTYPGNTINSVVALNLSNNRAQVLNPVLCDVFDVSVMRMRDTSWLRMDRANTTLPVVRIGDGEWEAFDTADFVVEYAIGPNAVNTQAGPFGPSLWPADTSSIQNAVANCQSTPAADQWSTDPTSFGSDWQDRVNMIRVRPVDPTLTIRGEGSLRLESRLQVRSVYNGGPHDGQVMPDRIRMTNEGGWTPDSADGWTTAEMQRAFETIRLSAGKFVNTTEYFPGDQVIWDLQLQATRLPATPMQLTGIRLVDTLPVGMSLDVTCTEERLPPGVDVAVNIATRQMTFFLPDVSTTGASTQWLAHQAAAGALRIQICATVTELAQTGDRFTNQVQGDTDQSPESNFGQSTITIIGPGKLGIAKGVDRPYVASGETYTWNLDWGNTSTTTTYAAPDIIDVLPWDGDNQPGTGSKRDGYGSSFTGVAQLTGPLAQPTYTRGGSGVGDPVPGTWYYTTAAPDTLSHDARAPQNLNPGQISVPGQPPLWVTAASIGDFSLVTGIRFVHDTGVAPETQVRALIPEVSMTNDLDVWYVNRGAIYTPTSPGAILRSNQPAVQIPGFSLGDLVWLDRDPDGMFDVGVDEPVPGVLVEVLNEDGDVIATRTTNAQGRWSVSALPPGTYRARIPASQFQPGAPLGAFKVQTVGSSAAEDENESVSNSNTAAPDPRATGLTSSPVTLAYVYQGTGDARRLVGGDEPTDDDVANLAPPRVAADFTNFTVDLALAVAPFVDIEKHTNTVDADEPTGPYVTPEGAVQWTYIVTNTGSTDLFDIVVTDDVIDASQIDCGEGSNVVPGPLAVGASFTCVANGVATAGQYANLGSVVARGPLALDENGNPLPPEQQDPPVTDEDWSHYFGALPDVDIEKLTNGADADEPTGPHVPVGGAVRWAYIVTNTGNVPLTDLVVTDDKVAATEIDCGNGSNVVPGPLAVGESYTCIAEGVATAGQYANLGTVVANGPTPIGPQGEPLAPPVVTDEDPSHYYGDPPVAVVGGLAFTGGQLMGLAGLLGVALLLTGGVLFSRRRGRQLDVA